MCEREERDKARTRATQILGKNRKLRRALLKRAKETALGFLTPGQVAELEAQRLEEDEAA